MSPSRVRDVMYFADENALGLANLLIRQGRTDILHPGHVDLPEAPRGTADLDWMPRVADAGLIVLSRDRRIRTRPAELAAYRELGIRSVWLGGKPDLAPTDQLEMFLRFEQRLLRVATRLGPGPWAVTMTPSGVRPVHGGGAGV